MVELVKVWRQLPLFLFILFVSYIHYHIHRGLSPFSSLLFFLRGKNLPCGAEPGFHLGPAIQQASAIQTEPLCSLEPCCTLMPCCTLEPHCTFEPRCTLKPCCTLEPQIGRRIFIFVNISCWSQRKENWFPNFTLEGRVKILVNQNCEF